MQVSTLCESVQKMGGADAEDNKKLEEKVSARMDDRFSNEEQARQRIRNEMMHGCKNEESARQLVRKELAVVKDEIKNLRIIAVPSVARHVLDLAFGPCTPPPLASRYHEIFIPRKMKFKGWITDYPKCSF